MPGLRLQCREWLLSWFDIACAARGALQDGPGSSSGSGGSDVRAMYREALSGGGGMAEMALLRLMQRTKPVWNELGYELCTQLLAAFVGSLQARPVRAASAAAVPSWCAVLVFWNYLCRIMCSLHRPRGLAQRSITMPFGA